MQQSSYLSNLTPLRGIAAIFVIIFHCDLFLNPASGILVDRSMSPIIAKGYLMVDFFFVLSGFIMSYVYLKSFESGIHKKPFRKFIQARFARVYPLHLFTFLWVLALYFILVWTGHYHEGIIEKLTNNVWAIPSQLVLLHSMHLHNWTTWNGPSWSISVEWWMYLLFPLLAVFLVRAKSIGKIILLVMAWAGMWWIVLYIKPNNPLPLPFPIPTQYTLDVTADYGFLRCLFGFLLGMVFYELYKVQWMFRLISKSYFFVVAVIAMIACMHFDVYDTFTALTFPFIILAAAYNTAGVQNFFKNKPLQYIGDLSYSVYLTHFPIFVTIASISGLFYTPPQSLSPVVGWIICIVWIAVTLLVSSLTYRYLEVPARNWINDCGKIRETEELGEPVVR